MQIIRKHNYRGYLPVETLNTGICKYDPYEQVPRFINEVRQAIASAFEKKCCALGCRIGLSCR